MELSRVIFEITHDNFIYDAKCYLNDANTGLAKWYIYRSDKLIGVINETRVRQFVNPSRAKWAIKQAIQQANY